MGLQIRRLSYTLGAIGGIDIRKPLDDQSFRAVHTAYLEHGLLLFRGQPLTREQHIAFSRCFGELDTNDAVIQKDVPEYPELLVNRPEPGKPSFETQWHSDQSYTLIPSGTSLLRGVEIPDVGGDTMFANMYLAYETLSDGMKKLIEGLHGVNVGGNAANSVSVAGKSRRIDTSTAERSAETAQRLARGVAQPLVRVHPKTGRKALYVNERIREIVGMTAEESKPLIQFLCQHATRPQLVYRHQWQKDDLLVWDNYCLIHIALGDYDNAQVRQMERTTVKGTPSGYLYEGPLQ